MDIVTITAALSPYLIKGGEKIAEAIGEDLWALIKKPFTKDKDKTLLKKLEENPADATTKGIVEYKLAEVLEENPELLAKLTELLAKLQPQLQKNNTINISGSNNVGIQDVTGGSITINNSYER